MMSSSSSSPSPSVLSTSTSTTNKSTTRMPAEWHPHDACLILYPHNSGVFRDSRSSSNSSTSSSSTTKCAPARLEVRNVARTIINYGGEDVILFCNTQKDALELEQTLQMEKEQEEEEQEQKEGHTTSSTSTTSTDHAKNNRIIVKVCPSDDSWCRDTGPTFAIISSNKNNNEDDTNEQDEEFLVGLDWKFNAYGGPEHGCYWPCTKDQQVTQNIISILNQHYYHNHHRNHRTTDSSTTATTIVQPYPSTTMIQHIPIDFILEGGSIHTDGEGTILTTEECLLNPNRNPHLSKDQIEQILMKHLNATKVIWLPYGLAFDTDTNGHVDNIATFARPTEIVLSWTDTIQEDRHLNKDHDNDDNDDDFIENYDRFRAAERVILNEVDAKGRQFVIHKLYIPEPMYYTEEEVRTLKKNNQEEDDEEADHHHDDDDDDDNDQMMCDDRIAGERLAGSYVNYYMANNAIILPQFGDNVYDLQAKETMKSIFPDLDIRGVYSREILLGGGNIHCITQQMPSLV